MEQPVILKTGTASKVVFFYTGEEGTFISNCVVTLYSNGIAHVSNPQEEITTHISNIEIVWKESAKSTSDKVVYLNKRTAETRKGLKLFKNNEDPELTT